MEEVYSCAHCAYSPLQWETDVKGNTTFTCQHCGEVSVLNGRDGMIRIINHGKDKQQPVKEKAVQASPMVVSGSIANNKTMGINGVVILAAVVLLEALLFLLISYVFGFIIGLVVLIASIFVIIALSFKQIRPTERGLVERLGKFNRYKEAGLVVLIPFLERLIVRNITETLTEIDSQEIITKDTLNAIVDAQIYWKVKPDKESVMASQYNVNNVEVQIVQLARTTLRAIIGSMTFSDANTQRNALNETLATEMQDQTKQWGISVVRTELKQITPPKDVQQKMNDVINAEKTKIAAIDLATAVATKSDGERQAIIKVAEGKKEAIILEAQGKSEAIKLVNTAAQEFFTGNAITLKQLETVRDTLMNNTKVIVPQGSSIVNVLGDSMGIIPILKDLEKKDAKKM